MSAQNRIKQGVIKILNSAVANGAGVTLDVSNYKTVVFQLATSGNATATIKFAASISTDKPNFGAAQSATNVYDFVEIVWLNNNSSVPGSTGIVLTGTDQFKIFEVNTNYIKWLCPIISGYAAGKIDIEHEAVNDYTR